MCAGIVRSTLFEGKKTVTMFNHAWIEEQYNNNNNNNNVE